MNRIDEFKNEMSQFIKDHYVDETIPTHYYGHTYHSINIWFFPTTECRQNQLPDRQAVVVIAGLVLIAVAVTFLVGTVIQLNQLKNSFQVWSKYSQPILIDELKTQTEHMDKVNNIIPKVNAVLFKEMGDIIIDIALIAGVIIASGAIIAGGLASLEVLIVAGVLGVIGVTAYRISKFVYDQWSPSQDLIDIKAAYDTISPPQKKWFLVFQTA